MVPPALGEFPLGLKAFAKSLPYFTLLYPVKFLATSSDPHKKHSQIDDTARVVNMKEEEGLNSLTASIVM